MINPHITDVGPPLGRARDKDADRAVQEFKMAKARPNMAKGVKWRLSSALWPMAAYTGVESVSLLDGGKLLQSRG